MSDRQNLTVTRFHRPAPRAEKLNMEQELEKNEKLPQKVKAGASRVETVVMLSFCLYFSIFMMCFASVSLTSRCRGTGWLTLVAEFWYQS